MATKSQEILLKGNTINASAVPSSLKVREIAINALDRSLFTNDGNSIVKLYTGTNKWFDVNGNANNALKLGGVLASEYINKEAFNSHINNSIIHITANERTAWNNKWDYNEETIKAVKVNAAVNADYATSAGNADTLDGFHISSVVHFQDTTDADTVINGAARYLGVDVNAYHIPFGGGELLSFGDEWYSAQLYISHHSNRAAIRGMNYGTWSNWHELAFLDSNVASATKLLTPRTLWGRLFDGSANVDGDLKDVGNITASGKATIQGDIISGGEVAAIVGEGTPAGVTDYSALTGKPQINGVTLVSGNNTLAALGIQAAGDYATNSGVTTLLANYPDKTFVSNNYVGKSAFNNHTADTDIHITASEREAWNAKWDYNEATIKAVKVTSASSADSVAWSGIKDKPSTFTPSAHTHNASDISGLPTNLSAFNNDVGFITGITKSMVEEVLTGEISSHIHSYLPLSGGTISGILTIKADGYPLIEFKAGDTTYGYYGFSSTGIAAIWDTKNWQTLLHSANYNSYAPTLTGTGASGTWGISISGNAASATKLATPRTLWGQRFDGSGDVNGVLSITTTDEPNFGVGAEINFHLGGRGQLAMIKAVYESVDWSSINPAAGSLCFYTAENTSPTEKMRICPNGNVLIGTITDNGNKLQVQGAVSVSGNRSDVGGYAYYWGIDRQYYLGSNSNTDYYLWATTASHLRIGTSNTERVRITSGGNVLIGTAADNGYKLQVNGSERVYGDLIVDGEVSALVA